MRIAIIGGDKRMLFAARELMLSGAQVKVAGFDTLVSDGGIHLATVAKSLKDADAVVLPIRPAAGEMLNAPFAAPEIPLRALGEAVGNTPVFSGNADAVSAYFTSLVRDYAAREDFLIPNAALTAEGAVGLLVNEYEGAIFGARILVLGYGRIGRILSRYLRSLGASVTVAARRASSRSWAVSEGLNVYHNSCEELKCYDIVINTVPAAVLKEAELRQMHPDCFIIDLASMPGGVDREAAQALNLTCIHALALPGRTAPAAAGRIIKDTILQMIKEENGGKDNSGLCDDRLLLHL